MPLGAAMHSRCRHAESQETASYMPGVRPAGQTRGRQVLRQPVPERASVSAVHRALVGRRGDGAAWDFYSISAHVRRWMVETYGEKCSRCGWCERHPVTGKVPLTIDHIDGDVANCAPGNLRLLCNNCHSLTPTFGTLNWGKGKRPNHKGAYFRPPSSVG